MTAAPQTIFFKNCLAVFQGGGCRGAAHAGAYRAAAERGVRFSRVAGTSAGSIVAALIGAGASPAQVMSMVAGLDFMKFMVPPDKSDYQSSKADRWVKGPLLKVIGKSNFADILTKGGQYSSSYIEGWMNDRLRELLPDVDDPIIRFKHLKLPTFVVATDLEGLRPRVWSKERTPEDPVAFAVRASCSIPGFFQPVAQGNNRLVDGGMLSNLPAFVFKDETSVWRLQPERILAFRLKSAYKGAIGWSPERLVSSLVGAAIEGATELQADLQGNVHMVTIPTEDIVATDFEKMTKEDPKGTRVHVERLVSLGEKSTREFLDREVEHVTKAAPPVQALLDRFEVYQCGVQHAGYPTGELIITSDYTRWLWDLFPTLFHLKRTGTRIHVIVTPPGGDQTSIRLEKERRKLLVALGIRVVQQATIPFIGYLFDGGHPTNARAVVYTHREGEMRDIAVSLSAPGHRDVIETMWNRLLPWIDDSDPVFGYSPGLDQCDHPSFFGRLKTVKQYSQSSVSIVLDDVPVSDLKVLSPSVRNYKLEQVPWIDKLYAEMALDPYVPIQALLSNGSGSIVTPPVVEEHGSKLYVIDGKTRAYRYFRDGLTSLKCVLIRNADPNLPGPSIPLADMTIVNREPTELRFPSATFRNIEQAVHP